MNDEFSDEMSAAKRRSRDINERSQTELQHKIVALTKELEMVKSDVRVSLYVSHMKASDATLIDFLGRGGLQTYNTRGGGGRLIRECCGRSGLVSEYCISFIILFIDSNKSCSKSTNKTFA